MEMMSTVWLLLTVHVSLLAIAHAQYHVTPYKVLALPALLKSLIDICLLTLKYMWGYDEVLLVVVK